MGTPIRRSLLVLVVCLWPMVAQAQQPDYVFRGLLAGTVIAHGMDLSITAHCLGAGTCREANPFLRHFESRPVPLGAVKMASASLSLWAIAEIHKDHPKLGKWLLVASIVGYSAIAITNARRVNR